jgi:hypothetical protein
MARLIRFGGSHRIDQGRLALEAVSGILANYIQEMVERDAEDEDLEHLIWMVRKSYVARHGLALTEFI